MEDVQKLKRKRKMKGDQLGRAMLGIIANGAERKKDPTIPLYMDGDTLATLVDKIDDGKEAVLFNFYQDLYFAIHENKKRQAAAYNDARGCLNTSMRMLQAIAAHNNCYGLLVYNPLVITSEERKIIVDHAAIRRDIVIQEALKYPGAEGKPEPIREAVERARRTKSSEYLMQDAIELPDGTKIKEFRPDGRNETLEAMFLDGKIQEGETAEEALARINRDRYTETARHAWLKDISLEGVQYPEIEEVLEYGIQHFDVSYLIEPARSETERLVREILGIPALPIKKTTIKRESPNQEMDISIGIYPDYYLEAVTNYVNGIEPGDDWISWKGLEDAGLLHCTDLYKLPFQQYAEDQPAGLARLANGLAVIDDNYDTGVRRRADIKPLAITGAPAAEVYRGMKFVYGFNAMIDIYADVYEVPELVAAKLDTASMERYAEQYNTTLTRLWAATPEQELRDIIRAKMEYIKMDQAKPDPDKVEEMAAWFRENRYEREALNMIHFVDLAIDQFTRF